jgi:tetratricopeptide (TPR) repeat protein
VTGRLQCHRWLLLLGLSAALAKAAPGHADDRREIEQALEADPKNVDLELRLALVLAREGELEAARTEAEKVASAAPEYWDAHLLLARIDGWQERYDEALRRVEKVLEKQPTNREAAYLKLDLLTWKGDVEAANHIIDELLAKGHATADLYYRKAELEQQALRSLSAYRYAKSALAVDPGHEPARELAKNTRLAAIYFAHELEYFDYRNTEPGQKWGYGFTAAVQALPRARISLSLLDTFRYRFQDANNQVGLEAVFRPARRLDLTLRGLAGAPAVVVPRATGFVSARVELWKRLDATLSYQIDLLPWPRNRPAILERPALDVGVFVHPFVRLGAGYTPGLFHHCGEPARLTHGARCGVIFDNGDVTASLTYGYGEEYERNDALRDAPPTCEDLISSAILVQSLVGVTSHTIGLAASKKLTRTVTLRGGYALSMLVPATSGIITLTHTVTIGGMVWF